MKNTKRCYVNFPFWDRAGLAAFLEEQAAKGWMIRRYLSFCIEFQRIEPAKYRFSVIYYRTSVNISAVMPDQLEFLDYCARTGWQLVTTERRMLIFVNRAENPIPIETDPSSQLENIHASVKKQHLSSCFLCLALALLYVAEVCWMDLSYLLSNPFLLVAGIHYCDMGLVDLIGYYIWLRKAKRAAAEGIFWERPGSNALFYTLHILAFLLAGALTLNLVWSIRPLSCAITIVLIAAAVLMALWYGIGLLRKRLSTAACRAAISLGSSGIILTMLLIQLVYLVAGSNAYLGTGIADPSAMPLSVTELTGSEFDSYVNRKYQEGTWLIMEEEYRQTPLQNETDDWELRYTVTYVRAGILNGICRKDAMEDFTRHGQSVEIDATIWRAQQAFQFNAYGEMQNTYLLYYDGYIVQIKFDWAPTSAQMQLAGEKLAGIGS